MLGLVVPFSVILAQEGSVVPSRGLSSTAVSVEVATTTEAVVSSSRAVESVVVPPRSTPPREPTGEGIFPRPTSTMGISVVAPGSPQNIPPSENDEKNSVPWNIFAAIVAVPLAYAALRSMRAKKSKKDTKDTSRCFDLKKIADKKLQELTDMRGAFESKAQDAAREKIKEAVRGTSAEAMLDSVEKAEKEYERLKKLYEECMVQFEKRMFKGTIIENSLNDKSALEKVQIEKTYRSGNWILHDVLVREEQIEQLSKYLAHGPWYMHFWEPGHDTVKVVFKNRIFSISSKDKSTWVDALAHGKSIGIPDDQLDFPVFREGSL